MRGFIFSIKQQIKNYLRSPFWHFPFISPGQPFSTCPSFTFPWKLTLSPRNFSNNPSLATPDNKSKWFFLERHLQLIQSDLDSFFYSLEQFFVVYMEYVCVYIYTYTHVYVFMYTHVHVYIHTSTHIYKHSEHLIIYWMYYLLIYSSIEYLFIELQASNRPQDRYQGYRLIGESDG